MAGRISLVLALALLLADAPHSHAADPIPVAPATNKAASAPDGNDQRWGDTQVVVYKSKRTLAVYRHGDFLREYRVSLGLQPLGRKRHANDARTPEGLYRVVAGQRHPRWQWFLSIDYPNESDRRAYRRAVDAGRIPDENGAPFAIGGSVGIHGNDRPEEQEKGTDWTKGCIAMKAEDIAQLAGEAPVGTPVWIVE